MTTTTIAFWYDKLSGQDQYLYDMIEDICPDFSELDGQSCQDFIDQLDEVSINTAEQFRYAYESLFDTNEGPIWNQ